MMRGDGRGGVLIRLRHILGGLRRGDVLHNDFELRILRAQWFQDPLDKHGFAVKNINLAIRDFAMHQQRQTQGLHFFQRPRAVRQVGHTRIRVGGSARWIEFHRFNPTVINRVLNVLRRGFVG